MLKVDQEHIDDLNSAVRLLNQTQTEGLGQLESLAPTRELDQIECLVKPLQKLRDGLHRAMRLEASTIPPYLVAAWSVQDSDGYQNKEIRELILSVAREEMLHMMAVANLISALGTPPEIASSKMVLNWGTDKLPIGGNLRPSLAPFSMDLLSVVFMEIEKPKNPVHYVVIQREARAFQPHYGTIGEFYEALRKLINTFELDPFANGSSRPQIKIDFDVRMKKIGHAPITDFEVKNRKQAVEILDWIVDQGEGTSEDPLDGNENPAHYYRFAEIYKGGKLVEKEDEELGYAYDKANHPINCDFDSVRTFEPNPKMAKFDPGSRQYKGLKAFNNKYKLMFEQLGKFYNGEAEQVVVDSVNSMNNMAGFVDRLMTLNPPVCPSFEWITD